MTTPTPAPPALVSQADFDDITALISAARQRAVQAVNTTLIGQTISRKIGQAQWGDGAMAWWPSWPRILIILNQSQRLEEREFYLRQAIREQWSSRELARQFKTALFERTVHNPLKVTPLVSQTHPDALSVFKDSYLELGGGYGRGLEWSGASAAGPSHHLAMSRR